MQKVRLYLAITAYVILIKRIINESFIRVFRLHKRTEKLILRLRKATSSSAKKANGSAVGKVNIPLHTYSSLGISKGYQTQIIRI